MLPKTTRHALFATLLAAFCAPGLPVASQEVSVENYTVEYRTKVCERFKSAAFSAIYLRYEGASMLQQMASLEVGEKPVWDAQVEVIKMAYDLPDVSHSPDLVDQQIERFRDEQYASCRTQLKLD